MKWLNTLTGILSICLLVGSLSAQPNVVYIIVDDLNDLPYQPDGKPLVPTPNIDRLKAKGVTFTNAHTNDPLCAPSRASMLFGLYPQTTSLYWFENWQKNGILNTSVSLHDNLRNGGYTVYGTGKIYHGLQKPFFDEYGYPEDFGPWPWDGRKETTRGFLPHPAQMYLYEGDDADMDYKWEHVFGPLSDVPTWQADPENDIPGHEGWILFGKPWKYENEENRDLITDELAANWTEEVINRKHENPYALFVGLTKTHTPLYAPQNYFDRFPLEEIQLPAVDPNDLEDVSEALGNEALYGFRRYKMLARHEDKDLLRKWLQAYMACVSFIDDQVGKILDAVESGPDKDNTVVILTSDHGFHVGEKNFLYKGSLWEPSTHIPLIIAGVPGAPSGESCDQAVSLIDIYPTFNDICALEKEPNRNGNGYALEGHSLLPLLTHPGSGDWAGPEVAITTIPGKNHMQHRVYEGSLYPHFSVRGKRYRYSLTSTGEEELYDHEKDPFEWENVADDPAYLKAKESLKAQLIQMRDGQRWTSLQELASWEFPQEEGYAEKSGKTLKLSGAHPFELSSAEAFYHFELEFEAKVHPGQEFTLSYRGPSGQAVSAPIKGSNAAMHSHFQEGVWNTYRIRVHNKRHQLWINNRYVSDEIIPMQGHVAASLQIQYVGGEGCLEIREARIRHL